MDRFQSFPEQLMGFFMLGFPLVTLLMLGVLGGLIWAKTWGWIDDSKPGRNPVLELMARLRGWVPYTTEHGGYFWWKDKEGATKCDVVFAYAFTAFLLPLATFLSIKFYPVLLTALTLLLLAYVARFARRHKKLFDKHLKDPEAHK
ncbi:hypothetical protein [Pseudomonas syringae]|uniref:hypothetical protein n=1 Tax=Pseudomonas syringae TaxID=317 RepID=UPI0032D9131F